jgi:hypothetical protein
MQSINKFAPNPLFMTVLDRRRDRSCRVHVDRSMVNAGQRRAAPPGR